MYLFAKNDLGNIDDNQLISLREFARIWLAADDRAIEKAMADGEIVEVESGKSDREEKAGAKAEARKKAKRPSGAALSKRR